MSLEQQIQEVEVTLEQARRQVKLADAIKRLETNPDFKLVFKDAYFTHEAARLVALTADDNMQSEQSQLAIQHSIRGIGELRQFLSVKLMQGEMAEKAIIECGETLDELRLEEANQEA